MEQKMEERKRLSELKCGEKGHVYAVTSGDRRMRSAYSRYGNNAWH